MEETEIKDTDGPRDQDMEERVRSALSELKNDCSERFTSGLRGLRNDILTETGQYLARTEQTLVSEFRTRYGCMVAGWIVAIAMMVLCGVTLLTTWEWRDRLLPRSLYVEQAGNTLTIPLPQVQVYWDNRNNRIIIKR